MNILVFGKDGQLGKAFQGAFEAQKFGASHDIQYVGRAQCDLSDADAVMNLLHETQPQLIFNAAAYTAVDQAEQEIDLAYAVNANAPAIMAQYAVKEGATLVHYSTDYVFDGTKATPYLETDARNPLGIYGKSKAAGEAAIEDAFRNNRNPQAQFAILRTSWVYGDGGNFIRTILRLAKEREVLKIISDQHGAPTSSAWLAGISLLMALGEDGCIKSFPSGIYHAVPNGQTTWHGLATLAIQSAMDAGVQFKVDAKAIQPILTAEYSLPAPRPMNSRMSTDKLRSLLVKPGSANAFINEFQFPEWENMVREYVHRLVATGAV
ncbi:dTDP-4-dehydrorhamnose reductase [Polynucleobacter sp. HIN6]|uniref:dTDP-4-dehydrorhamnose reductase n=1 Tax=Polynucleobacter sp. HIN6 TaxID=3047865 RepID=UPI0025743A60|nr:dTDP-4-dehydrorhamnose reductase [Polynucleobacter sp. HIN6]BEI34768.1 dTDP-4-dehydrorhamnose reductase [Polynucleobacter sp. HIN6]